MSSPNDFVPDGAGYNLHSVESDQSYESRSSRASLYDTIIADRRQIALWWALGVALTSIIVTFIGVLIFLMMTLFVDDG